MGISARDDLGIPLHRNGLGVGIGSTVIMRNTKKLILF